MKQILIALSQLGNTLTGGMADETISARTWREDLWLRHAIDAFFWLYRREPQHCFSSYVSECERRQLPNHYRNCQE